MLVLGDVAGEDGGEEAAGDESEEGAAAGWDGDD